MNTTKTKTTRRTPYLIQTKAYREMIKDTTADATMVGLAFDRQVKASGNVVKGFRTEPVEKLLTFLEADEDRSLYEVVPAKNTRPFFDIDYITPDDSDREAVRKTAVEGCKHILSLMYPKGVGEVVVLDGSRETADGFKHSIHITAPGVVHPDTATLLSLLHRWIDAVPVMFNGVPLIDNAIYTTRRCFRLAGQSKLGQGTPLKSDTPVRDTLVGTYGAPVDVSTPTDWVVPSNPEPYHPEHVVEATPGFEELAFLLNQTPSDIPKNDWVVILNVIDNLDAPFEMANQWSANGGKRYNGTENVKAFWDELCYPNYTIATLQAYMSQYNPNHERWTTDKTPWADFDLNPEDDRIHRRGGKYVGDISDIKSDLILTRALEASGKTTSVFLRTRVKQS